MGAAAASDPGNGGGPPGDGNGNGGGADGGNAGGKRRLAEAYRIRNEAARDLLGATTGGVGTIGRYERKHGTFTKGLPHNEFGEVDLDAYDTLDAALEGTDVGAYNDIELGVGRDLANPIASYGFNLCGADGHQDAMPAAPPVGSDETAAEMVELYWRALLRDVPFEAYGDDPRVEAALDELRSLDGYAGPTDGPASLFRSGYPGAERGPHVSQFLLQDAPFGAMTVENTLRPQEAGVDYLTDFDGWLAVRRGDPAPVGTETFAGERRRITNGRDLLTYVHRNVPSQSALSATYHLLGGNRQSGIAGDALAVDTDTDLTTQNQFVEFGPPFVTTLANGAIDNAKHGTWYHKWLVHRRARPEKYGGLVEVHRSDRDRTYDFLNDDLLGSEAVSRTQGEYGTALLPQGYPEGSPTHPAYPAGHSVFIGTSVTILKALFDGDATLDRTVRVDGDGEVRETGEELTVRGELNKLASNHAFGRDFSGIHYRSDGVDGHLLGEQIALRYLKDELRGAVVDAELSLRGFGGDEITVRPGEVTRG